MAPQKIYSLSLIVTLIGVSAGAQNSKDALVQPPEEIIEAIDPELDDIAAEEDFEEDQPVETNSEPLPLIKQKRTTIDSRYFQNRRLIEHPNASKGLIKINKDRVYIYKVPTSEEKGAASVRLGVFDPTELENPDNSNLKFTDIYTENDFPMFQYDYEKTFSRKLGKLGWKAGIGVYVAQGNGQFENATNTETPREQFTILIFPISLGLVYRLQFFDTQPVVPYFGGGVDLFTFAEIRDDDLNPDLGAAIGAAPAAHFKVGGAIRLGRGARAFVDLDREYGINSVSIIGEYKSYIALSDTFDFTSEFIGAGILLEY